MRVFLLILLFATTFLSCRMMNFNLGTFSFWSGNDKWVVHIMNGTYMNATHSGAIPSKRENNSVEMSLFSLYHPTRIIFASNQKEVLKSSDVHEGVDQVALLPNKTAVHNTMAPFSIQESTHSVESTIPPSPSLQWLTEGPTSFSSSTNEEEKDKTSTSVPSASPPYLSRLDRFLRKNPHRQWNYLMNISGLFLDLLNQRQSTDFFTESGTLASVLMKHSSELYYKCDKDRVLYSFCQYRWIVNWDSASKKFYPFSIKKPLPPGAKPDFTYVTHTSVDRLHYFKHMKRHWKGAFSIAIFAKEREVSTLDKWIQNNANTPNLRLVLYVIPDRLEFPSTNYYLNSYSNRLKRVKDGKFIYPINFLRDLAICNVMTTHYMNLDMDLWPSLTTYSNLHRISRSILDNWKSTIILPAFQLTANQKQIVVSSRDPVRAGIEAVCKTKDALRKCVSSRRCTYANPTQNRHNCVSRYWYNMMEPIVVKIPCLNFTHMEPYVILRRDSRTPLYHPFYVNYGFNKVTFIENLRFENYQFYLMITDFGFDFPHKQSVFVDYFIRDLQNQRRSAKITMNRAIMAYFDDPENESFKTCSSKYFSVCC